MSRARLGVALALVYVVWGSTYLAIRYVVETLPPFLAAGTRFLIAGGILFALERFRGTPRPTIKEWRSATVIGALLLLVGNGAVMFAEQRIPSGLAALLTASTPLWMVTFDWLRPAGRRPTGLVYLGLLFGLVGVGILLGPGALPGSSYADPAGAFAILGGSMCWALGSIYSRHAPLPSSPLMSTGAQMLCGGTLMWITSTLLGEWMRLDPSQVALSSVLALGYLVIAGSLLGFTAYVWLLRATTPALASSYSYVNPVVAVLLGWIIGGEALGPRVVPATLVIVTGLVLLQARPR